LCNEGALILFPALKGGYAVYIIVESKKQDCFINRLLPKFLAWRFELYVRDVTESTSVETLKRKLVDDIELGGAWEDRGDYDRLASRAENCKTLADVFDVVLGEPDYGDEESDD
jgi:hypothetical protein